MPSPLASLGGSLRGLAPGLARPDTTQFFKQYADAADRIEVDGLLRLFADLGVAPDDPVAVSIAYVCNAAEAGLITKEQFLRGMKLLRCETTAQLRKLVPDLRKLVHDPSQGKKVFEFAFTLNLDAGSNRLGVDDSIALWRLMLPDWPLLEPLCAYAAKTGEAVKRDVWSCSYDLARLPDLSHYDMDGAWPVMLDEFVEEQLAAQ